MTAETAKLVVLGAGPGGYAAAFYAADLGMEVTLVDEGATLGGVCLNRGCIPSKALLHITRVMDEARSVKEHGVDFGEPKVDLDRVRGFRAGVVTKLTGGLTEMARARKVAVVRGRAKFGVGKTVFVDSGAGATVELKFASAIVATGSLPSFPPALGGVTQKVWDSTVALEMSVVPRSLLVVGGGYIGLELGSVYAGLGSAVTVVEMTSGLLPGADPDLVRPLAERLAGKFKEILLSTKVAGLEEKGDLVRVTLEGADGTKTEREFERVLVAVGRRPNGRGLGLEDAGVAFTDAGFVRTDRQCRTSVPGIFAIGDVAGQPMLAHKAAHEARVAVDAVAGRNSSFEPRAIPGVVFTDPEVAWCGLTEAQARAEGRPVKAVRFPWAASGRALTIARTEGVTKLVVDPETERILGVGITGAGAGELISEGALAIETGATVGDLALTIHPHPTISETLMEAAEAFHGLATHLYRPRRT